LLSPPPTFQQNFIGIEVGNLEVEFLEKSHNSTQVVM
jgi:hypothetical protein